MKVLVTGASGFIGYNTLRFLLNNGYEIHALTTKNIDTSLDSDVKWHKIDLLENNQIDNILKTIIPDCVLHFAWYAIPGKYANAEENLDWLICSIELLKRFKKYGGKKFIFAGSCFQYDLNYGYLSEEITPSIPNSLYGICKNSFENIAIEYCKSNDISFASGRIFHVYGERENENRIVPYVINSLINDKVANCSHGKQIRDFMHVEDVASAFVKILDSDVKGVVNIGSGEAIELKDILFKIGKKLSKEELINLGVIKDSENEPKIIVANNDKLKNETKWVQKYTIDDGIEKAIEWWKKVSIKNEK